jgi:hypothetical protein
LVDDALLQASDDFLVHNTKSTGSRDLTKLKWDEFRRVTSADRDRI